MYWLIYTVDPTDTSAKGEMITWVVCAIVLFTKTQYEFNIIKTKYNMLKSFA